MLVGFRFLVGSTFQNQTQPFTWVHKLDSMILHGPEPVLELDPIALHGSRPGQENDLVGLKGFLIRSNP
jgi:hypothetical protein